MKKLLLLGAVLAGTAHAQTYSNGAFGTNGLQQPVQQGQTTVMVDRYGNTVGAFVQQPQYEPKPYPYYTPSNPSPYTPDSIVQEQRRDQQQRYYGN